MKNLQEGKSAAFTLIELLIVVAIIAILAAIAVPNFMEAQVRAKISRAKSDMRSLATAIEAYAVDYTMYPIGHNINADGTFGGWYKPLSRRLVNLTTPVSFISSLPRDPFPVKTHGNKTDIVEVTELDDTFDYVNEWPAKDTPTLFGRKWRMACAGPDMKQSWAKVTNGLASPYDATNGTKSFGDIVLVQGGGDSWWTYHQ